jgi:hypothetical protein
MNKDEITYFKNIILPEGVKSLYFNDRRYSKSDILKIKQSFKPVI